MSLDFNHLVTVRTLNQLITVSSLFQELNWHPKFIKSSQFIPYNTPTAVLIQVPNFYQGKKMLLERIAIRAS
jgi:hypothetical protein